MKRRFQALLATAALLGGTAFATTPRAQGPDLQERVTILEAQVASLVAQLEERAVVEARERELLAQDRRQLDAVVAYLQSQSQSAKALEATLAESRELGFTYGINPDSRHVLLAGMGQFVTALQSDVPAPPEKPAANDKAKPQPRPARR